MPYGPTFGPQKKQPFLKVRRFFFQLVPLNNRNYLIMSEVNKTLNSKHQTRSLWERGRQQVQCIWQRHRRCSLLLPGHHCCHLFVVDMFTTLSKCSPSLQESSSSVVTPSTFGIMKKIMFIIMNRSQVCSSSSEHKAWLGLASYPRSRQHDCLPRSSYKDDDDHFAIIVLKIILSMVVITNLINSSDGWFAWPLPWIQSHIR